jgi:hypothetical protein
MVLSPLFFFVRQAWKNGGLAQSVNVEMFWRVDHTALGAHRDRLNRSAQVA